MTTLAETQHLLWRLITAPEGVEPALAADEHSGGSARATLCSTVRSGGELDAIRRLDVYANMYFFRLLDVLKDDYPATLAVIGGDRFHNVVTDYLLVHPPTHYSIRVAGRALPDFLATHPLAAATPYLPHLAAFERDLNDAFDAADASIVDASALAAIPAAAWPALRFQLHPSVRLSRSPWPVHRIRERVDRGEAPESVSAGATALCVWRRDLTVRQSVVADPEWQVLRRLNDGADFATACEAALSGETMDVPGLVHALASWLTAGVFAAIEVGPSPA